MQRNDVACDYRGRGVRVTRMVLQRECGLVRDVRRDVDLIRGLRKRRLYVVRR